MWRRELISSAGAPGACRVRMNGTGFPDRWGDDLPGPFDHVFAQEEGFISGEGVQE